MHKILGLLAALGIFFLILPFLIVLLEFCWQIYEKYAAAVLNIFWKE